MFEALVYKRAGDELLLSDLPRACAASARAPAATAGRRSRRDRAQRLGAGR